MGWGVETGFLTLLPILKSSWSVTLRIKIFRTPSWSHKATPCRPRPRFRGQWETDLCPYAWTKAHREWLTSKGGNWSQGQCSDRASPRPNHGPWSAPSCPAPDRAAGRRVSMSTEMEAGGKAGLPGFLVLLLRGTGGSSGELGVTHPAAGAGAVVMIGPTSGQSILKPPVGHQLILGHAHRSV